MSEYDFKNRCAEGLRELKDMIQEVARQHPHGYPIQSSFHSIGGGGFHEGWHYADALFLCSVEYHADDVESQIEALKKIGALSEHISRLPSRPGWRLPTGKRVTTEFLRDPEGRYHLQVTENDPHSSSLSSPVGPGGLSWQIGLAALGIGYALRDKPTVGLAVAYRFRSRKKRPD